MDFVTAMRGSPPDMLPMSLEHHQPSHSSNCPAMRAAAEQNQHSRGGGGGSTSHYDPVHGNSSGNNNWWSQLHHHHHSDPHQPGWHYPPYPHFGRSIPMYQPPFPPFSAPGPGGAVLSQANPSGLRYSAGANRQVDFGAHAHPHAPSSHSPPFTSRPTIPSLQEINRSGPRFESHAPGTTEIPALSPIPPPGGQPHHSTSSPRHNGNQNMDSTLLSASDTLPRLLEDSLSREPVRGSRADNVQSQSAPNQPAGTIPPISQTLGDQPVTPSDFRRISARIRRPRLSAPNSEPSSDEDADSNDQDSPVRFLEAVGLQPPFAAPDDRIRAQQLLRGAVSTRRVASRAAITALQSVDISGLPEIERTCIICYNEFGVENPEGINEAPLRLPKCKHVFGDHCIKKWFEESDSCPYCRDKVPSESQYRHADPRSVVQFIRQTQMAVHSIGRQSRGESSSQGRFGGGFSGLAGPPVFPPLSNLQYDVDGPSFSYPRRDGNSHMRSSNYQGSPERRSPPGESNENRRRTRARHSSLRGSPPSARPNSYAAVGGQAQTPFTLTGGRQYPSSHNQRHSLAFSSPYHRASDGTFEPPMPVPYTPPPPPMHQQVLSSSEQYMNPLHAGTAVTEATLRPTWPSMRGSSFAPPIPPPFVDTPMTYPDDASHTASQQSS